MLGRRNGEDVRFDYFGHPELINQRQTIYCFDVTKGDTVLQSHSIELLTFPLLLTVSDHIISQHGAFSHRSAVFDHMTLFP